MPEVNLTAKVTRFLEDCMESAVQWLMPFLYIVEPRCIETAAFIFKNTVRVRKRARSKKLAPPSSTALLSLFNRIRLKSDNSAVELGGANFFDRALFLTLTVFLNINAAVSMHLGSTIYRKGINH